MMRFFTLGVLVVGALLSGCSERCPVEQVNLGALLSRMTNLNTFAEAPLGDSFLESSYDRAGGNNDWAVYTKPDGNGRITVFDQEGPGYVSRFWIASFYAKKWFFFFDGEDEPRWVLEKDDFFGGKFPFVAPLAGQSGGGRYCLLPIPFSRSLRIEMEPVSIKPTHRNYFQINYTRLALDSDQVESFPGQLSAAQSNLVAAVNKTQQEIEEHHGRYVELCSKTFESKIIEPGAFAEFWSDDGEGVLKAFCMRIDSPSEAEVMTHQLLRGLRIQMFWDGLESASVDVPLGDFFCNPLYYRSFSSMPLAQLDGTFICRFPMPYKKGARCRLVNTAKQPVSVSFAADGGRESSGGLTRRFHAVWRAQNVSGTSFKMLETSGSGHYVGCFLSALGQDGTWTILEGDEILRPDAGKQPAQYGTGLEDYFNGAYYYTSLFDLPFHGLIEKGAMRTDQYRFHMLEAVSFGKSFEMEMEFGDRNRAKGYMSSVAFWYAEKATPVPLPSVSEYLLKRPGDRFELPGLIVPFFLLERSGLYADAASRMDFFAQRYQKQPWSDLLKVRAVGYREQTEGFDAVKKEYESMTQSSYAPAAQVARDRIWLSKDPSHALLGIHSLGKYSLKLDERLVAEGSGKNDLSVLRVTIEKGTHTWDVDLLPTYQGSHFSICLRTQNGDITSAGEWDIADIEPLPGRTPPDSFIGDRILPNMSVWAFQPNAYVNMQSPASGLETWAFWDSKPKVKRVRLKKEWSTEDVAGGASSEVERSDDELKEHAIN